MSRLRMTPAQMRNRAALLLERAARASESAIAEDYRERAAALLRCAAELDKAGPDAQSRKPSRAPGDQSKSG